MLIFPSKTDSELVIDPNAVLPFPIAAQLLKTIARRVSQVIQPYGEVDDLEFSGRDPGNVAEPSAVPGEPELPGFLIGKGSDHGLL